MVPIGTLKIGSFWLGSSIIGLIEILFLLPETTGRTYNELDELFKRGIPAGKFAITKTAAEELKEALSASGVLP